MNDMHEYFYYLSDFITLYITLSFQNLRIWNKVICMNAVIQPPL